MILLFPRFRLLRGQLGGQQMGKAAVAQILAHVAHHAVMALTMRAKQPKRGVVACEDGFIEIYNYPRGDKATITYTSDGHTETIEAGETALASLDP